MSGRKGHDVFNSSFASGYHYRQASGDRRDNSTTSHAAYALGRPTSRPMNSFARINSLKGGVTISCSGMLDFAQGFSEVPQTYIYIILLFVEVSKKFIHLAAIYFHQGHIP